jgi:hypothetical protein
MDSEIKDGMENENAWRQHPQLTLRETETRSARSLTESTDVQIEEKSRRCCATIA